MNNNKNGYEIRSDILAMAKDFVLQEYYEKVDRYKEDDRHGSEPEFPTVDQMLEVAYELYDFVERPDPKRGLK